MCDDPGCVQVGVLTNNWVDDLNPVQNSELSALLHSDNDSDRVDVLVESCKVGHRKPDPEIFRLTADRVCVCVRACVCVYSLPQ